MATSGPTIWTSIEPTSALEERPGPGRWRDLRAAINLADSLRFALPVKTMALGEYISSSLSARFPDKMAQKRWTSLLTSSDEIFFIFWLKDSTGLHSAGRSQPIQHFLEGVLGHIPVSADQRANRKPTQRAELLKCSRCDYATALCRSAPAISATISSAAARGFAAAVIGRPTTR